MLNITTNNLVTHMLNPRCLAPAVQDRVDVTIKVSVKIVECIRTKCRLLNSRELFCPFTVLIH